MGDELGIFSHEDLAGIAHIELFGKVAEEFAMDAERVGQILAQAGPVELVPGADAEMERVLNAATRWAAGQA